jgi:hypothetical protein
MLTGHVGTMHRRGKGLDCAFQPRIDCAGAQTLGGGPTIAGFILLALWLLGVSVIYDYSRASTLMPAFRG